ncbi:hypothetical protein [Stenotrophomonas sp.]|uniref:hypothetical protein n=1 Tax=Stenotrophomonas sp. TaxID=69392 RepID=UPI002FCB3619
MWALLCAAVLAGWPAFKIASRTETAPLRLEPGATVVLDTLRLRAGQVQLSLRFARTPGEDTRDTLGKWSVQERPGFLVFEHPGEPVVVRIENAGQQATYAAFPASASWADGVERDLGVQTRNAPTGWYRWPPLPSPVTLPQGRSQLTLTVLDVGPSLRGQRVALSLHPAMGFKSSERGYDLLWLYFFWPILVAPLLLYGLVLCLWTGRQRRRARRQPPADRARAPATASRAP